MDVTVVGSGYVGLVSAAGLAHAGHRVRAVDADPGRIEMLRRGVLPFVEPGLPEIISDEIAASRLTFELDGEAAIAAGEVILVAVGTHDGNGGWQTDSLANCLTSVARHARAGAVIAIRSTVPPDRLDSLATHAAASRAEAGGTPLPVVLNPEFTREGSALRDFLGPDRIVIGAVDDPSGRGVARMRELYDGFRAPILTMSGRDACMAKLGSNLFLATKISFANELARLCDRFGARVDQVVNVMALDPRIGGAFLRPGVGFGGSCLPNQVAMTVRSFTEAGEDLPLLAAVDRINHQQRLRCVDLLDDLVGGLPGRRIALFGLTFKPGTDDLRDAPALEIAAALIRRGATVIATDPMPPARARAADLVPGLMAVADPREAATGADAVALVTEWPELCALDWREIAGLLRGKVVLDGRNALDPDAIIGAGLTYAAFGRGVGRPEPEMAGAETVRDRVVRITPPRRRGPLSPQARHHRVATASSGATAPWRPGSRSSPTGATAAIPAQENFDG